MDKQDDINDLAAPDLKNKGPGTTGQVKLVNTMERGHIFASCGKVKPGAAFTVPAKESMKYIKAKKVQRYAQWVEENES